MKRIDFEVPQGGVLWVPDGLADVRLDCPGAVEVVVIGSRVTRRQNTARYGSGDGSSTLG